ncbi:DUF2790 domain-containing protein [Pseudomonas mediterranea]|jgi:hypothetical protein|uniref:DUF2790 domain-containing protein n=1 Tax=Pseudomonas mediterranea TaxID=183795 RepID=UPI0006D8A01C|nr:DUF2790 domain-containing protein [Pseudomonas mediterranea]MBL0841551.1 DUF2790 domain-containing protein [Pseudomonas mediterranea]MDU9031217.1 DUF2790 domain-containing protein [Pseudomonas mediterranea]QHA82739.1 DUF2790 domain-containing protein [Pseudomonas mediterranea]UZD98560.1 DUF2790 domain-containing protein [Pseudomonas mediterranea]
MKIQNLSIASLLAIITLSGSPLFAKEQVQPPAYEYGMPLDVARAIRIEAPHSSMCEVVPAKMTYVDTQGELRQVSFLQLADACAIQ